MLSLLIIVLVILTFWMAGFNGIVMPCGAPNPPEFLHESCCELFWVSIWTPVPYGTPPLLQTFTNFISSSSPQVRNCCLTNWAISSLVWSTLEGVELPVDGIYPILYSNYHSCGEGADDKAPNWYKKVSLEISNRILRLRLSDSGNTSNVWFSLVRMFCCTYFK